MSSAVKPFPISPIPESPESRRATPFSTVFHPVIYRSSSSNSHLSFSSFLCRLISGVILFSLILAIFSLAMYFCLRPSIPVFRVNSVTLSNLNTSSSSRFEANFDVTLVFGNPNPKRTVLFRAIDVVVLYGQSDKDRAILTKVRLAPFSMDGNSVTSVRMVFSVVNEHVDSGVVEKIREEHARGQVNFEVEVNAVMRFKIGIIRSGVSSWDVGCYPVPISFPANYNGTGTLLIPMEWCKV